MRRLGIHCNRLSHLEEWGLRKGFRRFELFNFPPDELPALKRILLSEDLAFGVHAPLVRPDWYPDPPTVSFLCNVNSEDRKLTMRMIEEAASQAQDIGAEYLLVHFPSPCEDASGESERKLEYIAWKSCDWLAELSAKRGIPIVAEGVGASQHLRADLLAKMFSEYPVLRFCYDVGHMKLASLVRNLDPYEFAQAVKPFTIEVHLWNIRGREDYRRYHHIPVHPSQKPEEGWMDVRRIIEIFGEREDVFFILESPSSFPEEFGNLSFEESVGWVRELLGISSS